MEKALAILTKSSLKEKQLRILSRLEDLEGLLQYQAVKRLSAEEGMPPSTVRWNLGKLKSLGLVVTGDKDNKGIPIHLTREGRVIASTIKEGK